MSFRFDARSDEYIDILYRKGFVHIKNYFSEKDIKSVRIIADQAILNGFDNLDNKFKSGIEMPEADVGSYEINRATRSERQLKKTNVYAAANLLANFLSQKSTYYSFDHIIYKPAGCKTVSWHQDQAYKARVKKMKSVHLWIPLHDVSYNSGGMQYVEASNKGPVYQHERYENSQELYVENKFIDASKLIMHDVKVGDVIAHLPTTLHSSRPNFSNEMRKAWIIHFGRYGLYEPILPVNLLHYIGLLLGDRFSDRRP
jgi:hypothetical protein